MPARARRGVYSGASVGGYGTGWVYWVGIPVGTREGYTGTQPAPRVRNPERRTDSGAGPGSPGTGLEWVVSLQRTPGPPSPHGSPHPLRTLQGPTGPASLGLPGRALHRLLANRGEI